MPSHMTKNLEEEKEEENARQHPNKIFDLSKEQDVNNRKNLEKGLDTYMGGAEKNNID